LRVVASKDSVALGAVHGLGVEGAQHGPVVLLEQSCQLSVESFELIPSAAIVLEYRAT
jgi:hypothetical protein